MSDLDTTLPNTAQNFDAEELKEAIDQGELQAPELNVEDDYETAQKYSEGSLSAKAVEEILAPEFEVAAASEVAIAADSSLSESNGDTADYREMAKAVGPAAGGAGVVTDELVAKALEKGQAAAQ